MATHVMTPARRAALRKAQLASAAKRRKYGVGYSARRSVKQSFQAGRANSQLRRINNKKIGKQTGARKAAVFGAVGLGAGIATSVAIGSRKQRITVSSRAPIHVASQRVYGSPIKALGTGPKGKSAIRSRRYRAKR